MDFIGTIDLESVEPGIHVRTTIYRISSIPLILDHCSDMSCLWSLTDRSLNDIYLLLGTTSSVDNDTCRFMYGLGDLF